MTPTKANATQLLIQLSVHIDMLEPSNREVAANAALQMAKNMWKMLGSRANSNEFRSSFGELRRLDKVIGEKVTKIGENSIDQRSEKT